MSCAERVWDGGSGSRGILGSWLSGGGERIDLASRLEEDLERGDRGIGTQMHRTAERHPA